MNPRFFRNGYTSPPGEGRARLHHSRDGVAFEELTANLPRKGYDYGTFIHNYPKHGLPAEHFNFLRRGDLVVSATRPPLDDYLGDPEHKSEDKDWRCIRRSDDHLERAIFHELRRFFGHICRYRVELGDEMKKQLPAAFATVATINFHTKGKGTIRSLTVSVGDREREVKGPKEFNAAGYFLHLASIGDYPCGLILSFSMGGYENLLWNRIVRLRFDRWLEKPVFAFALLNLPDEPPQPLTPELADKAPAKILIEHWLDKEAQRELQPYAAGTETRSAGVKPATRKPKAAR